MKKSGDSDGWKRGVKGVDGHKGEDFAKADFDRDRQRGEIMSVITTKSRITPRSKGAISNEHRGPLQKRNGEAWRSQARR